MNTKTKRFPKTQYALQLIGPDRLTLNCEKPLAPPGPHEMLLKVEAVGLCFSDLKLLKQFAAHPRKAEVVSGLPKEVVDRIPSYVPGDKPTVFENVLIRTNDNWRLQIHLDTDDANAANIRDDISVEFLGVMEKR